jgi:hypothetical protein
MSNTDEDFEDFEDETPTTHTPGPWDWTNEGSWPDGISIAEVGAFNIIVEDGTVGDEEADARLIANAPMLLDACQEAYAVALKVSDAVSDPLHPSHLLIRGLRATLKHVLEDATGQEPPDGYSSFV